jgi:hypothetical protein
MENEPMQYMLLLYADEKAGQSLPADEMAMWMDKMGAYGDALAKAGAFVATGGLSPTTTARTIHAGGDALQVHNGPYADSQEQLGGYFIIEAASMDDAQRWAAQCPAALWGHIEIREIIHA